MYHYGQRGTKKTKYHRKTPETISKINDTQTQIFIYTPIQRIQLLYAAIIIHLVQLFDI